MLTKRRHDGVGIEGGGVPNLRPQSRTIGKARPHGGQGRTDVGRRYGGWIAWDLMARQAIAFRSAEGEFAAGHFVFFACGGEPARQASHHKSEAASGHVQDT